MLAFYNGKKLTYRKAAPGLTDEDRELLIQDARDRLAKINKQLEDVISELDVFER